MWQGFHLGFDFAGDYLIYERNYEGYLYNWKTQDKEKLKHDIDFPSISLNASYLCYEYSAQRNNYTKVIQEMESKTILYQKRSDSLVGDLIWINDLEAIASNLGSSLNRINVNNPNKIEPYLGPFEWGQGFLVGLSSDELYLYGNNCCLTNLNTLKVNLSWRSKAIAECGNRDLENFFILPDNTFMMRKTYYISDHEKRIVHPEYHWHLFDANGSNERRVDLQL